MFRVLYHREMAQGQSDPLNESLAPGLVAEMREIDWSSLDSVHDGAWEILKSAAEPLTLRQLFDAAESSPHLAAMAGEFDLLTKLVLIDDEVSSVRLRLHVFGDQRIEEAHNHRASFAALLLTGAYRHSLYGSVIRPVDDRVPEMLFTYQQSPGHYYALHHSMVHSTVAEPGTISLMLQGPRVRSEFEILDMQTGAKSARSGAAVTPGVADDPERRLVPRDFSRIRSNLIQLGLVAGD